MPEQRHRRSVQWPCADDAFVCHISFAQDTSMKFQRIEFSLRAAFIGFYMTPERDKVWVTVLPFFPLYFKRE
jgi:hypothetical protein